MSALERCAAPVVAAVHGACVGAGVDLVTAADVRLATQDARFSVKEVDLAIVAGRGAAARGRCCNRPQRWRAQRPLRVDCLPAPVAGNPAAAACHGLPWSCWHCSKIRRHVAQRDRPACLAPPANTLSRTSWLVQTWARLRGFPGWWARARRVSWR